MFLSDKDIKILLEGADPLIVPYKPEQLTANGYDMAIEVLDKQGNSIEGKKYNIKPNELIKVKSVEALAIPNGYIALMLMRSRYSRQGIVGMFAVIDSGFHGKIVASLKNLGEEQIEVKLDEGVIHVIFAKMSSGSDVPYGSTSKSHFQNQS